MFELQAKLLRFIGEYTHRLTSDIEPDRFRQAAVPGTQTPQWILGHLVLGNEYTLINLGQKGSTPREWFQWFGPGSSPAAIPAAAPGKPELLAAFDQTHALVLAALPSADPQAMQQNHTLDIDFLRQFTPTVGELIAHLLSTHPATHLGQLSFWRRAMGLPGVLA